MTITDKRLIQYIIRLNQLIKMSSTELPPIEETHEPEEDAIVDDQQETDGLFDNGPSSEQPKQRRFSDSEENDCYCQGCGLYTVPEGDIDQYRRGYWCSRLCAYGDGF